jgi:hypothetical protein
MDKQLDTLEIQIAKARENLSQKSRNAIDAVSWKLIILEINKGFNTEQIEQLTTETELLLCGLVSTENFPKELEDRMKISRSDVSLLLAEMDKLIFKKMQEELEKRLNEKDIIEVTYKSNPLTDDPNLIDAPKDIQTAVSLSNWKEKLYNISKKYSLSVEKMGELEDITVKTLKGDILASKYESEVKNRINVPDDREKEMVAEINEEIFKVIKDTLVSSSTKKENKVLEIPTPPYKNKKIDEVPLPPSSYKRQEEPKKEIKKVENIINEDDLYKEHGIEIISDIPIPKDNEIFNPINKKEIIIPSTISTSTQEKVEYREEIPTILQKNIIADKLSKNIIGEIKTSDYTLPKISDPNKEELEKKTSEKSINPHDPYHEVI